MYRVLLLLERPRDRRSAARSPHRDKFVDGRITNPQQQGQAERAVARPGAYQQSAQLIMQAIARSEEFREFVFPVMIAPPLMTRYQPGMRYGAHADAASCVARRDDPQRLELHHLPGGSGDYDGGALHIRLGDASLRFKLAPGEAIIYPSDTLHEVEPVTKGERLVAITFIQSQIADPFRRNLLFELNEVAALEGLKMAPREFHAAAARPGQSAAPVGRKALSPAFCRWRRPSSSAICTAFSAAPLRRLSLTHPDAEAVVDRRVLAHAADEGRIVADAFDRRDVAAVLALIDQHDARRLAQDRLRLLGAEISFSNSMLIASEWPTNTGTRTQVALTLIFGVEDLLGLDHHLPFFLGRAVVEEARRCAG